MFTIEQRKRMFAQQYLASPQEIYQAAVTAWPDDPRQGLQLAFEWAHDADVHRYCRELIAGGSTALLPPKEQIAKEILELGRSTTNDGADRLKAYELFAKVMGYIQPPQQQINNVVNSRVMVVKDHGSPEQWEAGAKAQQKRLIEGHANRTTKH